MGSMVERAQITVRGVVQGVGFRPYVYALADDLGLKGFVTNTAEGVLIDIEGTTVPDFLRRLRVEAPPLSSITDISVTTCPPLGYSGFTIQISRDLDGNRPFTLISPDVSICRDCFRELTDPSDRRYLYPFINCTHCGPRYSITKSVPYDRKNTTMASFTLCPACEQEYHDPKNRRFHAQPNACPVCGPEVEFKVAAGFSLRDDCGIQNAESGVAPHPAPLPGRERGKMINPLSVGERTKVRGEAMKACVQLLRDGGVVAIKGLGGFHIACDATNDETVKKLRERKRKSNKPFALMAPSVEIIRQFCEVSKEEQELLESAKRPIVLLRKRTADQKSGLLSDAVSPHNQYVGFMLPYTPLHYLLFHPGRFDALVMTSGNLSEEPIVHENEAAIKKLSGIVDAFLLHDRGIFMRVDDSVLRIADSPLTPPSPLRGEDKGEGWFHSAIRNPQSAISFLRRSRGYAPEPIALHDDGPEVLGVGADLKNTFTLTKGSFAIPSQHIGDMENYETLKFYEECLDNLKQVYRVSPVAIVHDLHPGYLSTRWAVEHAERNTPSPASSPPTGEEQFPPRPLGETDISISPSPQWGEGWVRGNSELRTQNSELQLFAIQHHYAHIGSVMAEHGLKGRVIGVAFDGTGYGTDGNLWGGEFLIADTDGFERAGQFKYIPLPGGESAIREPWRTAVSCIMEASGEGALSFLEQIGFTGKYGQPALEQVMKIARSEEFSPLSSGAGRLFDAVSAVLGICDRNTFEGEAATALESLTQYGIEEVYPVVLDRGNGYTVVDFSDTIKAVIADLLHNEDNRIISTRFHNTVASVIQKTVRDLGERHGIRDVALSGGTFQNLYLLRRTIKLLSEDGKSVYINTKVPPNDACISLGQAYIVRERLRKCAPLNPLPRGERAG